MQTSPAEFLAPTSAGKAPASAGKGAASAGKGAASAETGLDGGAARP
ncbi:MAG: hypothetical protein LBQ12_03420 [Deltaproteobacteria bacterium]|nr:hypothetical protein [Deltaproteobacteria bacterium]